MSSRASWRSLVLTLSLAACGGDDIETSSQSITHGSLHTGDPAVVAIVDADGQAFCTGTLIDDRRVLTAAHCLMLASHAPVAVFVGSNPDEPGRRVLVSRTRQDPDFDPETRRHDLAILELAESPGVRPMRMWDAPLDEERVGEHVRIVGFGVGSLRDFDARKRTGVARIAHLTPNFVQLAPDPSQPCGGDSGGPVFFTIDDKEYVVGVVSHGDWLCLVHANVVRIDTESAPFLRAVDPPPPGCSVSATPGASDMRDVHAGHLAAITSWSWACLALAVLARRRRHAGR